MSSPEPFEVTDSFATLSLITTDAAHEASDEQTTPRQTHLPAFSQSSEASAEERRPNSRESSHSGSDTEREEHTAKMPSGSSSSKHHSSSSSSKKHSSSSSSSKHRSKGDDWSDVTEPEERRRIQNRIAQRKFREKAREQKERQERDTRNQELAGSSYTIPMPSDFMSSSDTGAGGDDDLSGVPWGGLNIQHMVARGHKSASQQGGSQQQSPQLYGSPSGGQQPYYDYDYDYDNTTPQYGSGGYAGASSSYGYGAGAGTGAGSVGSYDAGGAGTGAGGADDRGGQWQQQQQLGGEVLGEVIDEEDEYEHEHEHEHEHKNEYPELYDDDDDESKGKGTAY